MGSRAADGRRAPEASRTWYRTGGRRERVGDGPAPQGCRLLASFIYVQQ